jgi:hypothetical protein
LIRLTGLRRFADCPAFASALSGRPWLTHSLAWKPLVGIRPGDAAELKLNVPGFSGGIRFGVRSKRTLKCCLKISRSALEDTGMGQQMQEYAVSQVLHWFRRFDDYLALKQQSHWGPCRSISAKILRSVFSARACLAQKWPKPLPRGDSLRCWSRSRKDYPGVKSFAGTDELPAFLKDTRVLINLLPNTAETVGIINSTLLNQLADRSYLMNLARGVHLVETDLLNALDTGKLKGAMLDVYSREPLPAESPLWAHPRVAMTPHVAAVTRRQKRWPIFPYDR